LEFGGQMHVGPDFVVYPMKAMHTPLFRRTPNSISVRSIVRALMMTISLDDSRLIATKTTPPHS
jgi:hypothetical protein